MSLKLPRRSFQKNRQARRPAFRPMLECLEDRTVPSGLIPNDPLFPQQWGLLNTGGGLPRGFPRADVHAPEAWEVITGSTQVPVGVIDTGVDYNHEDLYKNIWVNQGEIPSQWLAGPHLHTVRKTDVVDFDQDALITFWDLNDPVNAGLVNDNNGDGRISAGDLLRPIAQGGWEDGVSNNGDPYIDDISGWDFVRNTNDPMARNKHGTAVAGIIGAMGDNGLGVTGIEWRTQLVPLQAGSLDGSVIPPFAAIAAFDYAVQHRIPVVNASFGGRPPTQAYYDALARARDAGIVVVTAAGNDNYADDYNYPGYVNLDNVLTVGATTKRDFKDVTSQYSVSKVDLGAPGQLASILTTLPNGEYGAFDGTSAATPFVAGTAALVKALHPDWNYHQVIHQILATTDVPPFLPVPFRLIRNSFASGRLNAAAAVGPVAGGYLTGTAGNDQITVRAAADDPNRIEVVHNGQVAFADRWNRLVGGLTIEGLGGDDTLTLDYSQGEPLPFGGIRFSGGPGASSLVVTGAAGLDRASYTATGPGNGLLEFGGSTTRHRFVKFNDVADVTLAVPTGQLDIVNDTPMGSQQTFTDAGVPGRSTVAFNGGLAPLTFVNPTGQLKVFTTNLVPSGVPARPDNASPTTTTIASLGSGFNASIDVRASGTRSPGFPGEPAQDTVNLAADLNLGSDVTGGDLHIEATDIHVTGRVTSQSGEVSLVADRSITLAPGAALTTRDGDLTLQGNPAIPDVDLGDGEFIRYDVVQDGNFAGIDVNGASLTTTGSGKIILQGRGGNDPATGNHFGIWLHKGATVASTGKTADAGTITLDGTGGAGTGIDHGVLIEGRHTRVTSRAGALLMTGVPGRAGSNGVVVAHGARVTARGDAPLTVTGDSLLVAKGSRLTTETGELAVTTTGPVTIRGTVGAGGNSFALDAGGGVVVTRTGLLSGSGTVTGNLTNAGRLQPGGTGKAGTIQVVGDYRQTATGILFIELGRPLAGHFDQLIVSGTATLGGKLAVITLGGFRKVSGASYPVLTFGARGLDDHGRPSAFATYKGLDLSGAHILEPVFDATSMSLLLGRRHRGGRCR